MTPVNMVDASTLWVLTGVCVTLATRWTYLSERVSVSMWTSVKQCHQRRVSSTVETLRVRLSVRVRSATRCRRTHGLVWTLTSVTPRHQVITHVHRNVSTHEAATSVSVTTDITYRTISVSVCLCVRDISFYYGIVYYCIVCASMPVQLTLYLSLFVCH